MATKYTKCHGIRLQNRWSRVRIPPRCKVCRISGICIAVLLSKLNMQCHCVYLRKNASKDHIK
jgi:hypothetical protein